ncbi:unnamed protein product [Dicrocoelium dendriticum]|nr:unnamed protein product [Dicrocoelium dendriticum]
MRIAHVVLMVPVTQEEVDRLVAELEPNVDDEAKLEALGVKAYTKFFTATPQHIDLFRRVRGMDLDHAIQSDGIKYYGRNAMERVLKFIRASADEQKLTEVLDEMGKLHQKWNVTKSDFLSGEPSFTEFFKSVPQITENKDTMEKIMKHFFQIVSEYLE